MIVSDESHKFVATNVGVLGITLGAQLRDFEAAMYTGSQGQRVNKNYNVQSDFFKLKDHIREKCWKLFGYPPGSRQKGNKE